MRLYYVTKDVNKKVLGYGSVFAADHGDHYEVFQNFNSGIMQKSDLHKDLKQKNFVDEVAYYYFSNEPIVEEQKDKGAGGK